MKEIGVSILGFGTIGYSVYTILNEQKEYIADTYGYEITIRNVLVNNINKKRCVSDTVCVVNDIKHIVNDANTNIVVECIGGNATDETYNMILQLIRAKKHIIFSSKKCLAIYRKEIINEAMLNNVQIRYDATVGGGIPIFHLLDNLYGTDKVCKLYGIVNTTTNYILSLMKEKELTFEIAKNKAVQEGLAENNLYEDLDGLDAMYKLIILLRFGLGIEGDFEILNPNSFHLQGNIIKQKQIIYAEICENKVGIFVGFVDATSTVLETVNGKNNIICMESMYGKNKCIIGIGAGGFETASVIADDCIDILLYKRRIKSILRKVNINILREDNICIKL